MSPGARGSGAPRRRCAPDHADWIGDRPDARPQVDEDNLECVRDFLRREFRGGRHEDYFGQARAVQVFRIDATRGLHHTLIIPRATFEHADFGLLCNAHLLDANRGAGDVPVMLTPEGVDIAPDAFDDSQRSRPERPGVKPGGAPAT